MRSSIVQFCLPFNGARWLAVIVSLMPIAGIKCFAQEGSQAGSKNDIVVVVNADPITRSMLSEATVERFGSEILENMMNRYLILQECNARGIEVTKQEVSDEIRRLAASFAFDGELSQFAAGESVDHGRTVQSRNHLADAATAKASRRPRSSDR